MQYIGIRRLIIVSLGVYCFFSSYQNEAWAINLNVRRTFSFQEIYSDNINLAPSGSEQSALVTEISPGFNLRGQTARYRLNLNYRLQGIYNAGGNSGININNQLQFNSNTAIIPNRFFLDSRSSISQQNINNTRLGTDNFSGNNNSTTISTFSFSPYWTPHFSHYANGIVRATYDRVGSGNDQLSDTNSYSQNVSLRSGRYFSKINWSANFNNRTNQNSDGQDISFQNSSVLLRYNINRKFNLTAQAGHSSNSFQTTTNTNQNGFFYTFGGQWRPSRRFNVSAGWGNNSFVTVSLMPFHRLRWTTTYRNNEIGTNTGSVWQTNLRYNTRRSFWSVTYNEDTTTTQQVFLERQFFFLQDPTTNLFIRDPETNLPILFFQDIPTLTNDVFVRKRGDLSYSFRTGKSNLNATVFSERRTFQISQNEDKVYGITGSWNWRYSPRLNTALRSSWQNTDTNTLSGPFSSKFYDISFRVQRNFARNFSGNIEYRYLNQSSDNSAFDYDENRISIGLTGRF